MRTLVIVVFAALALCGCYESHPATWDAARPDAGRDAGVDAPMRECVPGERRTEACGRCGTRALVCTLDGMWVPGPCDGEGGCEPGTRGRTSEGCPAATSRPTICSRECVFEIAGMCTDDVCTPGEVEAEPCGMCGTRERTCSPAREWEYGPCTGEGVCAPGTSRTRSCAMCGTMVERCDDACAWRGGACMGGGVCAPGERRTDPTGCPPGDARLLECDAMCRLSIEVQSCRPTCTRPEDCPTGVCVDGLCQNASCTDGVHNGRETDIDCGGPTLCPRCRTGQMCIVRSDCVRDLCTGGICGSGADMCNTDPARVLVYGPGGDTRTSWFPAGTMVTVASASIWRSFTMVDFGRYDVIFIQGDTCSGDVEAVFGVADDTMATWVPAVRGRIVLSVDDADLHGGPPAERFYANLIDWLKAPGRNAVGGRTSLFFSWGCTLASTSHPPGTRGTPERFASQLGVPTLVTDNMNYCTDVSVVAAGHPVVAGLPPLWGCPFHGGFIGLSSDYTPLVRGSSGPFSPTAAARESPMPCVAP